MKKTIRNIFQLWVPAYGRPQRFLTDNGRKLANSEFVELAVQFDITVKTTPSEPVLPNGVAE